MLIYLENALSQLLPSIKGVRSKAEKRNSLLTRDDLDLFRLVEVKTHKQYKIVRLEKTSSLAKKTSALAHKIFTIPEALADSHNTYFIDCEKRPDSSLTPFFKACADQNIDQLNTLHEIYGDALFEEKGYGDSTGLMKILKERHSQEIIQWMTTKYPRQVLIESQCPLVKKQISNWGPCCAKILYPNALDIACCHGTVSDVEQLLSLDLAELSTEAVLGKAFVYAIDGRNLEIAKMILERKPSILNAQENLFLKKAVAAAVYKDQLEALKWLYSVAPDAFNSEENKSGWIGSFFVDKPFELARKSIILWLIEWDEDLVKARASITPFFENYILTCLNHQSAADHELLETLYGLSSREYASSKLIDDLFASLQKGEPASIDLMKYLLDKDYIPSNAINQIFRLPEHVLEVELDPVLSASKLMYKACIATNNIPRSTEGVKIFNLLKRSYTHFLSLQPGIIFKKKETVLPTGEALVDFYNERIPDIQGIDDPFSRLKAIFESIDRHVFHTFTVAGETETISEDETSRLLQESIDGALKLLESLRIFKSDPAIPLGKERKYYHYIHKILKHLVIYLEEKNSPTEVLTFLSDFKHASEHCSANFSRQMLAIYNRINPSDQVSAASREDVAPHEIFLTKFKDFFKQEVMKFTSHQLFSENSAAINAHINLIFQEFYRRYAIPFPEVPPVADTQAQAMYHLAILAQTMGISLEPADTLKHRVFEVLKINFLKKNLHFTVLFKRLEVFLDQELHGKESTIFLENLTDWLGYHGLASHELLKWDEGSGLYSLKFNGLKKLMNSLPKDLMIE